MGYRDINKLPPPESADAIGMEELDSIMNFIVGNLAKSASVKYGIGTRDYLSQRIRLLIALNKPINVHTGII